MTATSDIGFLEALDTSLDFIVEKVISNISEYHTIDDEDLYLIELNRFERANIILSNFYNNRKNFDLNNPKISEKLIDLVYNSLTIPFLMEGTNRSELEYLKENEIEESDEDSFLFNN